MTDTAAKATETVSLERVGSVVTIVEGSSFCISGRSGDIRPNSNGGLFFQDARFLSHWELLVNGKPLEPLSVTTDDPFAAAFVSRARPRPGHADSTLVVFRQRFLGLGIREDIRVKNFAGEAMLCIIELVVNADFAHVFDVKEDRATISGMLSREVDDRTLTIRHSDEGLERGIVASFNRPITADDDRLVFEVEIQANDEWSLCAELGLIVGDEHIRPKYRCGEPIDAAQPTERLIQWRNRVPQIETNHAALGTAVRRGQEDLGSLRIFDPHFSQLPVIAAGTPWFMTLFGRDSLLTAWMALLVEPDLSVGVLDALARFQGTEVNPETDEEPGKILHEVRSTPYNDLGFDKSLVYYGSADATPLFVMLLGELRRWGLAAGLVDRLLPHVDRALAWIENYGDADGDGYVEYQRKSEHGIRNQGWKDSFDSVRFADGRLADTPIALAEVQAYVYAAYQARKWFAREVGDHETAEKYRAKARALKTAFNRDFWMEDEQFFAMALDGDKKRVDAITSNPGHCLWTGIVDDDKAAHVARHLLSPEMYSGWGVRTLSTKMNGFNPIGYHTGSVWPHDNVILAAGLSRYGFVEEAQKIVMGLLDASAPDQGRLPELFSGLHRSELSIPVSFPTSCSPQAWAAASPLLALRTLLRFDPSIPQGRLYLAPALPDEIRYLRLDRIPLNGQRISVEINRGEVTVAGLDPSIDLVGPTEMKRVDAIGD